MPITEISGRQLQDETVGLSKVELIPAQTILGNKTGVDGTPTAFPVSDIFQDVGIDPVDCTSQINGTQTHFTFSPACASALVMLNGALMKPADVTLDVNRLGVVLAFPPENGDNLIILRSGGSSGGTETASGVIEIGVDGGGSAPTAGVLLDFTVPCDLTITGWKMVGNISGSIQIDLWKDAFANHPPTVSETVTASDKPRLSSAISASGSATGWTVNWNSGEIIRVNIDSATALTKANVTLSYTRR